MDENSLNVRFETGIWRDKRRILANPFSFFRRDVLIHQKRRIPGRESAFSIAKD